MNAARGADRAGSVAPSLWAFGPDDAPVSVRNAEALLAHLPVFLGGWPLRRVGDGTGARPDIDVIAEPDGRFAVRVGGPGGGETACAGEFEAAKALADGLVARFVAAQPDRLCLQAAAIAIGGGLVVLLGAARSGRTSVSLQLAAAGYRLFADDRLAIEPDGEIMRGVCLGLMPRLSLPLPPDCGARFAEFVEGYTEIRNESTIHLKLWEGEAAGFGESAPLAGLVILERLGAGPARLSPASPDAAQRALAESAEAPHMSQEALADRLDAIAEALPCQRLAYSGSRDAALALAAWWKQKPAG